MTTETLNGAISTLKNQMRFSDEAMKNSPKSKATAEQVAYANGMKTMLMLILTEYYTAPMDMDVWEKIYF